MYTETTTTHLMRPIGVLTPVPSASGTEQVTCVNGTENLRSNLFVKGSVTTTANQFIGACVSIGDNLQRENAVIGYNITAQYEDETLSIIPFLKVSEAASGIPAMGAVLPMVAGGYIPSTQCYDSGNSFMSCSGRFLSDTKPSVDTNVVRTDVGCIIKVKNASTSVLRLTIDAYLLDVDPQFWQPYK